MIDKEKVIKGLEGIIDYFFDIYRNETDSYKCAKAQEYTDCAIDAIALLKKQFANRPEIVRCKDCKYFEKHYYCKKRAEHHFNTEWFCADGERR